MNPETDDLDWSQWFDLEEVLQAPRGHLSAKGVVYQIRAVNESGEVRPQGRFLGTDSHGLLYIGKTKRSIKQRMKKLLKGRRTGRELTHTVGRKLHVLDHLPMFTSAFQSLRLQFRFAACEDPRATEKRLLRAYAAQFGETPPLNGEFPDRGDREAWKLYVEQPIDERRD